RADRCFHHLACTRRCPTEFRRLQLQRTTERQSIRDDLGRRALPAWDLYPAHVYTRSAAGTDLPATGVSHPRHPVHDCERTRYRKLSSSKPKEVPARQVPLSFYRRFHAVQARLSYRRSL